MPGRYNYPEPETMTVGARSGQEERPKSPGRRNILRAGTTTAIAATAMAAGVVSATKPAAAQAINDAALLNFALNLEYLEAEFYSRAVFGVGLSAADTSGSTASGTVIGGSKVPFTPDGPIQQYASEIANDEIAHVRFLRSALGTAAVAEPSIDLTNSFATLGAVIGMPGFNPFTSEANFLLGAYIFEDVGVTAYHGASALIQNKQILSAAAGILGTEAYHASAVRVLLYQLGYQNTTVAISQTRAQLSGAADDQGVVLNGTSNIVPADANSLVFSRAPRQVLNIVYGAQNATSGLFFPKGMNGVIK